MAERKDNNSTLVYSTEHGKVSPKAGKTAGNKKKSTVGKQDGIVRISRETKGRKGKGVTIITGVPLDQNALKQLAKKLKQKCGSGGTAKEGVIEIQGDHRDVLMDELKKLGYVVKRSGG